MKFLKFKIVSILFIAFTLFGISSARSQEMDAELQSIVQQIKDASREVQPAANSKIQTGYAELGQYLTKKWNNGNLSDRDFMPSELETFLSRQLEDVDVNRAPTFNAKTAHELVIKLPRLLHEPLINRALLNNLFKKDYTTDNSRTFSESRSIALQTLKSVSPNFLDKYDLKQLYDLWPYYEARRELTELSFSIPGPNQKQLLHNEVTDILDQPVENLDNLIWAIQQFKAHFSDDAYMAQRIAYYAVVGDEFWLYHAEQTDKATESPIAKKQERAKVFAARSEIRSVAILALREIKFVDPVIMNILTTGHKFSLKEFTRDNEYTAVDPTYENRNWPIEQEWRTQAAISLSWNNPAYRPALQSAAENITHSSLVAIKLSAYATLLLKPLLIKALQDNQPGARISALTSWPELMAKAFPGIPSDRKSALAFTRQNFDRLDFENKLLVFENLSRIPLNKEAIEVLKITFEPILERFLETEVNDRRSAGISIRLADRLNIQSKSIMRSIVGLNVEWVGTLSAYKNFLERAVVDADADVALTAAEHLDFVSSDWNAFMRIITLVNDPKYSLRATHLLSMWNGVDPNINWPAKISNFEIVEALQELNFRITETFHAKYIAETLSALIGKFRPEEESDDSLKNEFTQVLLEAMKARSIDIAGVATEAFKKIESPNLATQKVFFMSAFEDQGDRLLSMAPSIVKKWKTGTSDDTVDIIISHIEAHSSVSQNTLKTINALSTSVSSKEKLSLALIKKLNLPISGTYIQELLNSIRLLGVYGQATQEALTIAARNQPQVRYYAKDLIRESEGGTTHGFQTAIQRASPLATVFEKCGTMISSLIPRRK